MPPAMPPSAPIGSVSHRRRALPVEVAALRQHAADHARPQRDGIGDVGGDGRHADRGQRREGHQRPAARDRVHEAGGHPGQGDQGILQRGRRHRGVRHRAALVRQPSGDYVARRRAMHGLVPSQAMSEQTEAAWPIVVFTDGAAKGNPGPGGWGVIVVTPDGQVTELGGRADHSTNNRMELTGAINGLAECQAVAGSGRGLHGFDLRHPGHPPVDLGLAEPRLAHGDGHRGPEPRPVGAPVDAGRRARQGRHRLALRPRPHRHARQRARRRDRRRARAAAATSSSIAVR